MKNYIVQIDKFQKRPDGVLFEVSIMPSSRQASANAVKTYSDPDLWVRDVKGLIGLRDSRIADFLHAETAEEMLVDVPLSDEQAAYLGWST